MDFIHISGYTVNNQGYYIVLTLIKWSMLAKKVQLIISYIWKKLRRYRFMKYKFEEKLRNIIVSCCDSIDVKQINDDTDLVQDFEFDSINIIQLVVKLETEFDIEIDDDDLILEKLSLYKGLAEIIEKKISEK